MDFVVYQILNTTCTYVFNILPPVHTEVIIQLRLQPRDVKIAIIHHKTIGRMGHWGHVGSPDPQY